MVINPNRPIRIIEWKDFEILIKQLADKIKERYTDLEAVYGIPRGGSIIAVRLSHLLNVKSLEHIFDIFDYGMDCVAIVDDISDSGDTLNQIINKIYNQPLIFTLLAVT